MVIGDDDVDVVIIDDDDNVHVDDDDNIDDKGLIDDDD
jgi:hypothetical protein